MWQKKNRGDHDEMKKRREIYSLSEFDEADFIIGVAGASGYYIWAINPDTKDKPEGLKDFVYMHRDGSVHSVCGEPNFFDRPVECQKIISQKFEKYIIQSYFAYFSTFLS